MTSATHTPAALTLAGGTLALCGLFLAFGANSSKWYAFFGPGCLMFLDGINSRSGFSIFRRWGRFFAAWVLFLSFGVLIEFVANWQLHVVTYPHFDKVQYIFHTIVLGYPSVCFTALELFVLIENSAARQVWVVPTALLFGYVNEIPNVYEQAWVYRNWPPPEYMGIPLWVSLIYLSLIPVSLLKGFF